MTARQNPLHIGIIRGIQFRERITRPLQDAAGDAPIHVFEKAGIAPEAAYNGPREENPEQQPPAPGIPFLAVEIDALFARPSFEQALNPLLGMDQRQDAGAKHREVSLEFTRGANPLSDIASVGIPEVKCGLRKLAAASPIECFASLARR